jgi:DtxR family transcriptional regulator, Mn-dependent transcriptional regulator
MSAAPRLSTAIGDYLKAVWLLAGGGRAPVATSAIAEHLGVSPASVSGMVVRLQDGGWLTHERYRGVQLTAAGERQALRLVRRHRLIETFLIEYLGYTWDEVHDEAEAIEHAISDRFTERLAARLGHPTHDPHGDPIPTARGGLPATPNTRLADVEAGETLVVARLRTQEPEALAELDRMGIRPGQDVRVVANDGAGRGVRVTIDGGDRSLRDDLAQVVRGEVRRLGSPGDG